MADLPSVLLDLSGGAGNLPDVHGDVPNGLLELRFKRRNWPNDARDLPDASENLPNILRNLPDDDNYGSDGLVDGSLKAGYWGLTGRSVWTGLTPSVNEPDGEDGAGPIPTRSLMGGRQQLIMKPMFRSLESAGRAGRTQDAPVWPSSALRLLRSTRVPIFRLRRGLWWRRVPKLRRETFR